MPPFRRELEAALKAKNFTVEIENAGVSGDTASGGLARLDWSIPDGTDAVIVELGANDMLRGVDPKVTRKALDTILETSEGAQHRGAVLRHARRAQSRRRLSCGEFDAMFADLARTHDVVFYPFFLEGVAAQAKFALRDGIHPNAAGVDTIVTGILPKVEELIARVRAKRGS